MKTEMYHHCGTSGYFFIATSNNQSRRKHACACGILVLLTLVVRIINVLRVSQEPHLAKRPLQLRPIPQKHVNNRRAQAEVVAHLRYGVRRRVPREPDLRQLRRIERVLWGKDGGLVVRPSVGAEERLRHPDDVAPIEEVVVVAEC